MQTVTVDVEFHEAVGSGVLPKLPAEVYEDRFGRCRELMEERSLDVLVVYSAAMPFASCEWARYFANYAHPYWNSETFVVIPRESEPVFLINYGFMLDVARASSPIADVRAPLERFGKESRYAGLAEALRGILVERGLIGSRVGVCRGGGQGDWSPAPLGAVLDEALEGCSSEPADDLLTELILVKTPFDLEQIRRVSEVCSDGLRAACDVLGEEVPEYEPYLAFQRAVLEAGADAPLFHYITGAGPSAQVALRPIAACGRRLQRGDLFMADVGICLQGYYADMTRTAIIGEPSPAIQKLYDSTFEVVQEMVAELRPGLRAGRIADVLWEGIHKRGYSKSHVLIGHGIGTFINEPPFIMSWQDFVIREGMVINLEPAIYEDGVGGVRIEDPYLITENGAERLSTVDQALWAA
ncbi:MAG: Xaa-Pro peptidase family protein [Actinomycetota bacterium]|nr:Xaa-Pro peptidase family protein [Actinomycetota bacterium]